MKNKIFNFELLPILTKGTIRGSSIFLMSLLMLSMSSAAPNKEIKVSQFNVIPGSGKDSTEGVRAALTFAKKNKAQKIIFSPGRYDFYPDLAYEQFLAISNNDAGLKRIAFPLVNFKDIQIEGNGASFIFHGLISPFLIQDSHGVTIKDIKIDYVRPFHSEGKVLAVRSESIDLEFSDEFPYEIRNGVLVFTDRKKEANESNADRRKEILYPYGLLLAFDASKRETAFMAKDILGVETGVSAQALGSQQVRLFLANAPARVGEVLVFGAANRNVPGFILDRSSKILIQGVDLYHCGGMGVIAQFCKDITVDQVRVTPAPGGKRIVSITADATHFVNCHGKIELKNSLFENQKDDASNIHGLYAQISEIKNSRQITVRMRHAQQWGLDFIFPGSEIELTEASSLIDQGTVKVISVEKLNQEATVLNLEKELPLGIKVGDVVSDYRANKAEVLIKNCVIRNNRARGILLGSRGKIVVEGNTFHTPGSAILFEGDGRHWFEQSGVRDVTIQNNTFDNCNYGVWGIACIDVQSGVSNEFRKVSRYNRQITVKNNLFKVFSYYPLLYLYSVNGFIFKDNFIERTQQYPALQEKSDIYFKVSDSDHLELTPPTLK